MNYYNNNENNLKKFEENLPEEFKQNNYSNLANDFFGKDFEDISNIKLDGFLKNLKDREELLNIYKLFTESDVKQVETELIYTKEYESLQQLSIDLILHPNLYTKEEYKAEQQERFEALQEVVTQMVMKTYQENAEEMRKTGIKIDSIDELSIAFKDGTWTFTPLHIEEDGSKSIAARSCQIDLNYVPVCSFYREDDFSNRGPGNGPGGAPGTVLLEAMTLDSEKIEIKNVKELEHGMDLEY